MSHAEAVGHADIDRLYRSEMPVWFGCHVPLLGLAMAVLYVVTVFVAGPALLRRRTGRSAWLASWGATAWERTANSVFLLGCALDLLNPALAYAGVLRLVALPVVPTVSIAGAVWVASVALAWYAQQAMGAAWRTGIVLHERLPLVTSGPFRLVRNPTYTSLVMCSATVALLAPTWLAPVAVLVCVAALEIQTRLVEEPHLRGVHGDAYLQYAHDIGRFVPGVGRL